MGSIPKRAVTPRRAFAVPGFLLERSVASRRPTRAFRAIEVPSRGAFAVPGFLLERTVASRRPTRAFRAVEVPSGRDPVNALRFRFFEFSPEGLRVSVEQPALPARFSFPTRGAIASRFTRPMKRFFGWRLAHESTSPGLKAPWPRENSYAFMRRFPGGWISVIRTVPSPAATKAPFESRLRICPGRP